MEKQSRPEVVARGTEQINQALMPSVPRVVESMQETRIDLPFQLLFENLGYIGVVSRQTWSVKPHYHDHFELCYVAEGQGWFTIDEHFYQVGPGDLFLTKPGEGHQGAAAREQPFCLYYLGFQLHKMSKLEMDYYLLGIQRVAQDQQAQIRQLFSQLYQEVHSKQKYAIEMAQGIFLQLLVMVLRRYEEKQEEEGGPAIPLSPVFRQILQQIQGAGGYSASLEELASSVHLSRSHLAREFKRYMGVSLGQYTRTQCLDQAKYYLSETTETVSSIADLLHFSSVQTFSMFFKRHSGQAPQEYRKQMHEQKV